MLHYVIYFLHALNFILVDQKTMKSVVDLKKVMFLFMLMVMNAALASSVQGFFSYQIMYLHVKMDDKKNTCN